MNWWECKLEVNDQFDPYKCRDRILPALTSYSPAIKEQVEPLIQEDSSLPQSWNIDPDQMVKLI